MAAQTYPTPTARVGNYNEAVWKPLMSQRLHPGYIQEVYRFGALSSIFDIMDLAGRKVVIPTDTPKVFEKAEWENTVKTGTAITTGSAGASISFTIHADDQDTVYAGQTILIPAAYQTPGEDREYVITDVTSHVVTALPNSADATSITASQIGTQIPAGTVLSIVGYETGRGTALPSGKYNYRSVRTYYSTITKVAKIVEGGQTALKWFEVPSEVGQTSAFFEGQAEMELEVSKDNEGKMWAGELNDNALLVETSGASGSNKRMSTKGIWRWAKENGQTQNYAAGSYDMSYFFDIKDLALAKGVVGNEFSFLVGSDLNRYIAEGGLEFLATYSGGSDLYKQMDKLGFGLKIVDLNGTMVMIKELASLSNPLRFGNKEYNFSKSGVLIPESMESATIGGRTEKHPAFMIGYMSANGEDRSRHVGVLPGTTGRGQAVSRYDYDEMYVQDEFANIVLRPEQLIAVEPE